MRNAEREVMTSSVPAIGHGSAVQESRGSRRPVIRRACPMAFRLADLCDAKSASLNAMGHALRMTGRLDPRDSWTADPCPIAGTLDVITSRSAFLILREAFYGTTRFDDFAVRAGVSEPVAAARLRELVDDGLLAREDYREPG